MAFYYPPLKVEADLLKSGNSTHTEILISQLTSTEIDYYKSNFYKYGFFTRIAQIWQIFYLVETTGTQFVVDSNGDPTTDTITVGYNSQELEFILDSNTFTGKTASAIFNVKNSEKTISIKINYSWYDTTLDNPKTVVTIGTSVIDLGWKPINQNPIDYAMDLFTTQEIYDAININLV
jgi:hypothetical protein